MHNVNKMHTLHSKEDIECMENQNDCDLCHFEVNPQAELSNCMKAMIKLHEREIVKYCKKVKVNQVEDVAVKVNPNQWAYVITKNNSLSEQCPESSLVTYPLPETGIIEFNTSCDYSVDNGPFLDFFHPLIDLSNKQFQYSDEHGLVDLNEIKQHFQNNWQLYTFSGISILFVFLFLILTKILYQQIQTFRPIRTRVIRRNIVRRRRQPIIQTEQPLIPAVRYFQGGVEIREI
jgi:hypothetical protein